MAPKRKAAADSKGAGASKKPTTEAPPAFSSSSSATSVNPKRVHELKPGSPGPGPVIYWMSRDQRLADNWALLHAAHVAQQSGAPLAVAFNLVPEFLGAGARHFGFMLRGLRQLQASLKDAGVQFFMLRGNPADTISKLVADSGAGLLVTDYSPLRLGRQWKSEVASRLPASTPFHEVDAHNVVPVWVASDKKEIGARTLRPRIHKHLPEFLTEFPALPKTLAHWAADLPAPDPLDWDALITEVLTRGQDVPEVQWIQPGEAAARAALDGPAGFLSADRLKLYSDKRNDPATQALSGLSPYLHYGQLAPQRAALEAAKHRPKYKDAVESFLEELVVRRELSDNFCHYTPDAYDSLACAAVWARESLDKHRVDKREYIYTREQLDKGKTHDELWNAAQLELVHLGKMHGFMRMYWAKKILEWTAGPEDAIEIAIYLNDRYSLDGRDPSGYVGVMWSMVGIHDMGWTERAIFGKIRYMNYAGCKRKFKIAEYVAYVDRSTRKERGSGTTAPAAASGAGRSGTTAPAAASGAGSSVAKKATGKAKAK